VPTIEFLASHWGRALAVEADGDADLVDVCDQALAPIPFSCRSASCATCQIEVVEGLELLDPPEPQERELLDVLQAPDNHRLACQARIKSGSGRIRVRPVE
jgi:ferredoxin